MSLIKGSDVAHGIPWYNAEHRHRAKKDETPESTVLRRRLTTATCAGDSVVAYVATTYCRSYRILDEQIVQVCSRHTFSGICLRNSDDWICPVYLRWKNNQSHLCWLVRKERRLYRVEPHGTRPDFDEVANMFPGFELTHVNDVQPLNYGICRVASLYALCGFLSGEFRLDKHGRRWLRPMEVADITGLNDACSAVIADSMMPRRRNCRGRTVPELGFDGPTTRSRTKGLHYFPQRKL
jgi:hypothetical protein